MLDGEKEEEKGMEECAKEVFVGLGKQRLGEKGLAEGLSGGTTRLAAGFM